MQIITSSHLINRAYEIAVDDIRGNIKDYMSGLLDQEKKVVMAGGDYNTPWTRDASINVYNSLCYMDKDVSKNTLLSVMEIREDGKVYIAGQYWDCVIFALGAQRYYETSKDEEFFKTALEAVKNSLCFFEETEYSSDYCLFRGPAVYGDGVSAYPSEYGDAGFSGFILDFINAHPEKKEEKGVGMPMHALSTNCAYYNAYMFVYEYTKDESYLKKADALRESILKNFYKDSKLKYLTGKYGDFYEQEGLGISLGLKFGILPSEIFNTVYTTKNGMPCVYPTYERYRIGDDLGRHSGTVWSFIQCFYANEAARYCYYNLFDFEFFKLAENAVRDNQYYEIYHPETGLPYGGLQEHYRAKGIVMTKSCTHQTWNATGFISMLLYSIAGLVHEKGQLTFKPYLPEDLERVEINNLNYCGIILNISVQGKGSRIGKVTVNGQNTDVPVIKNYMTGTYNIDFLMEG